MPCAWETKPSAGARRGGRALRGTLSLHQEQELFVFCARGAFGLLVTVADVQKRLSRAELEHMIATGLNGDGLLCADVVEVRALRRTSTYEVTYVTYRGGTGRKTYLVEALKGLVFAQ